MAGRGRGKPTMSFSMEQLGISKGETIPTPGLQPTPNYPPLDHKPLPIQLTTETCYLIELKRDFTEYMRESPNYVQATILNEDIERFCEDLEDTMTECDQLKYETYYDWNRMPMELRVSRKRKLPKQTGGRKKKKKDMDIAKKLVELEKEENIKPADEEDKREKNEEEDEKDEEEKETKGESDGEETDEMDDGTDYATEYFQNGEDYISEDDNDEDEYIDV